MIFVRRLPRILYNHKYVTTIIFLVLLIFLYLLFHWRLLCSNIEPWRHVNNLCHEYQRQLVAGDLCHPLCVENKITSFSCQNFHAGKEIVFSAVKDNDIRLVFKRVRQPDQEARVYWTDANGINHYPTEAEFERLITSHIRNRLNITIGADRGKLIGQFSFDSHLNQNAQQRHKEMQEIWSLLQDNEYLMAVVFPDREVFPRVLGSCGQYFAVEYLEPALDEQFSTMISDDHSKENWASRVHLSVLILDLLEELDSVLPGGLSLCDVKPIHFGLSPNSGKMKFIDLDIVYPKAVVNALTADGRTCRLNSDCHMFDCRSKCNAALGTCDSPVTNNNLQIVCEKIFLGWTFSGSVIMPGLLMTPLTPSTLASLLRQCSDPEIDGTDHVYPTPSQHIKERLSATLTEIDRMLSMDNYN